MMMRKLFFTLLTVIAGAFSIPFLAARPVEFEYGLNLMDGIQVRQTYAGILISIAQPASDRTRYLLRGPTRKSSAATKS